MTDKTCIPIAELLVQYADGELPAADARRVAEHLADCPDCRAELRLLGRSLDLAREVWHQSAACAAAPSTASAKQWHTLARGTASRTRRDRRRVYAAACLAACAVVLLLTAGPWLFSHWQSRNEVSVNDEVKPPGHPQLIQEADVEALIAREVRSARLAASARLLATQPGLEEYTSQAERYLAEAYRGTAAVNGTPSPLPSPPIKEPES
jgi:anti-sigma factor RsiW